MRLNEIIVRLCEWLKWRNFSSTKKESKQKFAEFIQQTNKINKSMKMNHLLHERNKIDLLVRFKTIPKITDRVYVFIDVL